MEDFDGIFGVLPADGAAEGESDEWIQGEVDRREQLRAERKFAEADEIRDRLKDMGIVVEDTAGGGRWHREVGAPR
jgi:cysteinyl-tRNA synthetase